MLLLSGCGLGASGSGEDRVSAAPVADIDCARQGQVPGSGSTAQENAMKYWIRQYQRACSSVQVAYNPLGSGAGVAQFMRGATAFGGTDSPVRPDGVKPAEGVCPGGRAINLPMVGGAIAIGYDIPGVDDLVLNAPTLAKIFDSQITAWDDPAIRKLNPSAELPSLPIRAVHRADDSGTTQNFQAYLAGAAPEVWTHPAEKAWQGKGGGSAPGSSAVASTVASTAGSIGYFELSFAAALRIKTARMATGASEPVAATPESASAGIAAAEVVGEGKDLTLRFDYRTAADGTYPIVLVSYEVVCDKGNMAETLPALKSFLTYTASDEGQKPLARIHYVPLPESVATEVRRVVSTLS
ncbi:phosphate ABC transporter substrate-binding protein PstS [Streptomyces sp. 378]|uniref:phosphate ABC transporter substrate-binding protein PstS n=1 Tax=Streptomyces sp. 378 TaxID=3049412 RepID=UPI0024C3E9C8|nr:phosphate ABC transporter substrate-binding protein PstS [Streptomyces sp. 378]MDK1342036.1 phosphate ABC transporter substrate-binding protein PstS [Streptomyces sp. 378]